MVPGKRFVFIKNLSPSTTFFETIIIVVMLSVARHFRVADADPSGSCPLSSVSRCFSTVYANHRHIKTVGTPPDLSVPSASSCRIFEPFENCYAYIQCSDAELSQIAALEYFKTFQIFIPKEAATAFRVNLRQKCQPHCIRNAEYKCRLEMKGEARDKDNALVLELHAIKLQLVLRVTDPKEGCPRLDAIMARINYHRKHNCKSESMWCLCKQAKDKLRTVCPLNCASFKDVSNAGAIYGTNAGGEAGVIDLVLTIISVMTTTIITTVARVM